MSHDVASLPSRMASIVWGTSRTMLLQGLFIKRGLDSIPRLFPPLSVCIGEGAEAAKYVRTIADRWSSVAGFAMRSAPRKDVSEALQGESRRVSAQAANPLPAEDVILLLHEGSAPCLYEDWSGWAP
ncbi:hypothetical protein ACN47E_003537 [Coniothyrium glycines]